MKTIKAGPRTADCKTEKLFTFFHLSSYPHPQAQPIRVTRELRKVPVSTFNKALGSLVGTKTHWHVKKSCAMLTRQPNVSVLYVLDTASANYESSRVTRKMIATTF